MFRRKILAGNWKMNKKKSELDEFFDIFTKNLGAFSSQGAGLIKNPEVLFALPYTLLSDGVRVASNGAIKIAAQNMHWADSGAYTGEISASMLLDLGIHYTLIGHSERRQYFGETDETVAKKVHQAIQKRIVPIVCVGETLKEREEGRTEDVVKNQIQWVFKNISHLPIEALDSIIIAYEPVWAIGTGKASSSADAQKVHCFIREEISGMVNKVYGDKIRILYGGSASPKNIEDLLKCPDIDGGLVGGSSLNPEEFSKMVQVAIELQ
jgi:triosephosphate isomerase